MFGALNYGTAVYRNELAKRLHQIGYQTRQTGSAHSRSRASTPSSSSDSPNGRKQRDMAVANVRSNELGRKLTKT